MGGFGPMLGQTHHFRIYAPEQIPYAIDRYTNETNRLYGVLNKRLADRAFVAGEYSIADMAIVGWAKLWERQGQDIEEFPHVKRWLDEVLARPAVQRGLAVNADGPRRERHEGPGGPRRAVRAAGAGLTAPARRFSLCEERLRPGRGRYKPGHSLNLASGTIPMAVERTFSILKPDATERNLTGAVNAVIEGAGLRIVAQKRVRMTRERGRDLLRRAQGAALLRRARGVHDLRPGRRAGARGRERRR